MNETKILTIDDIARRLGLSKSTVSRALNGNSAIAEETRRRVQELAKELRFIKNVSAQRLTNRASRIVAFVTHDPGETCQASDLFGMEIMGGISLGLHELGYEMLVKTSDFRDFSWVRKLLDSRQVDGFVLMTSDRKASHIKSLVKEGAPFITWGQPGPYSPYPSVSGDDHRGGFLVGNYLCSLNRSPLAVLAGPEEEGEVRGRLQGFLDGLMASGRVFDPRYLRYGDYSEESAYDLVKELLALDTPPRGLFAHSDLMAIGVLKAAKDLSIRVPEDLAVVGFDDLLLASYVTPALTTVSQHIPLAGKALAQGLVRYLETGQVSHVVMPVELIQRGSA